MEHFIYILNIRKFFKEHFNAVWVKNEWSRFLKLMAQDKGKHLIPCYKGIDAYDMPKEFAKLLIHRGTSLQGTLRP